MAKHADALPECGVARFLILMDGPWATLIIRELLGGPRRFTALRQALPGISAHTLTSRLRKFEAAGLVVRTENSVGNTPSVRQAQSKQYIK